jgi:hypothetical protein
MPRESGRLQRDLPFFGLEATERPKAVQSQQRFTNHPLARAVVIRSHEPRSKIRALPPQVRTGLERVSWLGGDLDAVDILKERDHVRDVLPCRRALVFEKNRAVDSRTDFA